MPNGIETDPARAVNTQYPARLNTFNWYNGAAGGGRMYNINWTVPGNPAIFMPWEQSDNVRLTQLLGQRDTTAQGWQLIKRNLGYDDAGNVLPAIKNPYAIIYNRYTDVLRVFVATGELDNSYTFAQIRLRFNSNRRAGTLNRSSAAGIALEDMTPNSPRFVSIAAFQNSFGKWFYADFPMEYDPCVCLFDSKLAVEVNLIDELNVQLRGLSKGTLVSANASTGASYESDQQEKSPFSFKNTVNALSAGQKTYKTINEFSSGVRNILGIQAQVTGKSTATQSAAVGSLLGALQQSSFLKAGQNALPWIGSAVSMLDYFLGGGKEETVPNQPLSLQPMAIEFSTETRGTITANRNYVGITTNNPGTPPPPSVPEEYPYYNETMGVFSLIRRPVIDAITSVSYVELPSGGGDFSTNTLYQLRFRDQLRFAINPASGVRVQDMQAVLSITSPGRNGVPTTTTGSFPNFDGIAMMPGPTPADSARRGYKFSSFPWNAGCLTSNTFEFLDVDNPYDSNFNGVRFGNLQLKLIINLTRVTPSATGQNVLLVLTYPVSINYVSEFAATVPTCTNPDAVPQPMPGKDQRTFCTSLQYDASTMQRSAGHATSSSTSSSVGAWRLAAEEFRAYPNPATSEAQLHFVIKQAGAVRLEVSDALGRLVAIPVTNEQHEAGEFIVPLSTAALPAGVYNCALTTSGQRLMTRLVVVH